jgi:hypothetical protein
MKPNARLVESQDGKFHFVLLRRKCEKTPCVDAGTMLVLREACNYRYESVMIEKDGTEYWSTLHASWQIAEREYTRRCEVRDIIESMKK